MTRNPVVSVSSEEWGNKSLNSSKKSNRVGHALIFNF